MVDFFLFPNPGSVGLTIGILFAIPTLVFALRIPFKKNFHWIFILFVSLMIIRWGVGLSLQLSQDPETAEARLWWTWFVTPPAPVLLYHFILLFTAPVMTAWQKYTLIGGYLFRFIEVQVIMLVDPSLQYIGPAIETSLGWSSGAGSLGPVLRPFGISWTNTILYLFVLVAIVQYFRSDRYKSQGSALQRVQMRYFTLGVMIFFAGLYAWSLGWFFTGTHLALPFVQGIGMSAFMVALTRYKFLSIIPVFEKTSTTQQMSRWKIMSSMTFYFRLYSK